ncbi:PAS domain S-box protein [Chitinophaga silvatica]|uniref:histidine kinase n=1 Tax=Chitinophaga silvatica TaxID=2282649 RepID=A0A3E1Y625_9BACT|nr:PAS domain S-box protein [Chitinophaga silvatica]RFS20200.1 PAS domain S-box protein [Chitinophaga silvatica]
MINAPFQGTLGQSPETVINFLQGGGEAGKIIRSINWNLTNLGCPDQWPVNLQTCIRIMLSAPQPILIWWSDKGITFYNDACIPFLADKHPFAMGQPVSAGWKEEWPDLQPGINQLLESEPLTAPLLELWYKDKGYQFFGNAVTGGTDKECGIMSIGSPIEKKELYFDKTDITAFSRQVLLQFDKIIKDARLTLIIDLNQISSDVYINREMWEQMMLTLLTNAVKYTQTGAIAVRLTEEDGRFCFSVQDSGVGMTGQLISAIRKSFDATGIQQTGLQRLNDIVQLHNGEIQINSRLGEGSIFSVYIPLGKYHLPKEKLRNTSIQTYFPNNEAFAYAASNVGVFVERLKDAHGGLYYRQLLDCLPAAVYTCDKEGRILTYNKAAVDLWGRAPKPGVDKWCGSWKIFQPDRVTPLMLDDCPMALAIKEQRPVRGEVIVVERPDGSRRTIQPYPNPLFDLAGNLYGAVNMLVDITDQKSIEEQESRLAAIVESSDDAIVSKDLNGIITTWNPAAEQLFGYSAEEMIGTSIKRIIPFEKLDEEIEIIIQIKAGRKVDHFQTKRIRKDGEVLDISLTISPIKDMKGNIIGASKIARDITQQLRLFTALQESEAKYMQLAFKLEAMVELRTKELVEANLYLEKSNQELEQFAYVTSHDLQEPLRKIMTFAGILFNVNKELLSDTSKMYLEKVMLSARRMSQLINELLDYSRLVHVRDPFVETDLNEILKNVLTDFEVTISQDAINVVIDPLPTLMVSPLQMNQLFHNLIGNALKFKSSDRTPEVKVTSRPCTLDEIRFFPDLDVSQQYYLLSITDNGIGFDQVYAEKIFQIFQRLNDRSAFDGTGIGLALCRKIVLNHKGVIYANSIVNEGASFHVILPVV